MIAITTNSSIRVKARRVVGIMAFSPGKNECGSRGSDR
jgi:hypothetical protein